MGTEFLKIKECDEAQDIIKDLFDKSFDNSMNLSSFLNDYIRKFKLLDYEIEWLMILIFLPILDLTGINEIEKIVNFIKTMHHISCAFELEELFYEKEEKKEEFNDFIERNPKFKDYKIKIDIL